mmetsp:Transcript_15434/g.64079  ORF Transcript_15434/g.64079 Transcript_15434/m.64079 type:complete len:271 (+) Transcript_15434:1423-2235(+)
MQPAQPLALSSTSAYEKPPTKTAPRKSSSLACPWMRSDMVTSCGASPAMCSAAAISRSPLEPSSRMTATLWRGAPSATSGRSSNGTRHGTPPAVPLVTRARSDATASGVRWRRSIAQLVASHSSRSAAVSPTMATAPPTDTVTSLVASVRPTGTHGTSFAAKRAATASASASATSSTRPSSSAKSAASVAPEPVPPTAAASASLAGGGRSHSMPQSPPKAISSSVVAMPPSEMSCPEAIRPSSRRGCMVSYRRRMMLTSSRSGHSAPSWL